MRLDNLPAARFGLDGKILSKKLGVGHIEGSWLVTVTGARLNLLVGADKTKVKRYPALIDKITKAESALVKLDERIKRAQEANSKIRDLVQLIRTAYAEVLEANVEEEQELKQLYAAIQQRIAVDTGSMGRLAFTVKRNVDIEDWCEAGEDLLDLRTGPFRGRGQVLQAA